MKKQIFFLAVLMLGFGIRSFSQSLTFSRVIIIRAVEDTVPLNKVWKVESFMQRDAGIGGGTTTNCLSSSVHPIVINAANFFLMKDLTTGYGAWGVIPDQQLPFWLPAGYRLKTYYGDTIVCTIH